MMMINNGLEARRAIRSGEWTTATAGLAFGYVQANLAVLPREHAYDFLLFCQRNPKPCPVIEVTDTGSYVPSLSAPGADLRTDLPAYRLYRNGQLEEECTNIEHLWRDDLVAFLTGCSFTFEAALLAAGLPIRHIECGCGVSMYRTNIQCTPAGVFHGPMVVTMRPMPAKNVVKAVQITGRYPAVHGAPVHIGNPGVIGIADLSKPDYGDPVPIKDGEVPVFWACGVTPQAVAMAAKIPFMITHAPNHMFVTDLLNETLAG
jgi:uncharacterized protein YcsI (UPF0317 family)